MILDELLLACDAIDEDDAQKLVGKIVAAEQVFLIGVGRVMISLMAFCKRLNHIGVRAYCVGDLSEPAITGNDLLIVASGSGETAVPLQIACLAKRFNASVAHIGSNNQSTMKRYTDLFIRIPVKTKLNKTDELPSAQAMSSLFEQALYLFCDSVCLMIIAEKGLDMGNLWRLHANLE